MGGSGVVDGESSFVGRIEMEANRRAKLGGKSDIFVIIAVLAVAGVWCSAEVQAGSTGAVTAYLKKGALR